MHFSIMFLYGFLTGVGAGIVGTILAILIRAIKYNEDDQEKQYNGEDEEEIDDEM